MDFLGRMERAVGYIEEHIADDFDYRELAKIVLCDAYQFGRIFAYVTGLPLSEYIRGRRLSKAALELRDGKSKVIDVALKYGYGSPESFARAFRELHGISPREACAPGAKLRMCPRITFHILIKGDTDMEYRIEEKGIIRGVGMVRNLGGWTVNRDALGWKEQMGERWKFWNEYLVGGTDAKVAKHRLYRAPFYQMGVVHTIGNGDIIEAIGAEDAGGDYPGLEKFEIPAATWAVFRTKGTLHQKIHPLDTLAARIYTEWMPSAGYVKSMEYEIQVYGPGNTASDDYVSEIWIPVKKK